MNGNAIKNWETSKIKNCNRIMIVCLDKGKGAVSAEGNSIGGSFLWWDGSIIGVK